MRFRAAIPGITLLALLTGCAPATSAIHPEATAPIAPATATAALPVGSGLLGLYSGHIDPDSGEATLEPMRTGNSQDVLEVVDISSYLQSAPCDDCVEVASFRRDDDDHVVVSIGIRHPFPAGDSFQPISGQNRADLHVFNVEGILILNTPTTAFGSTGQLAPDAVLVNADGYDAYLDPTLDPYFSTGATLHPYRLHFADYSAGNYDPFSATGFASVTSPPPSGKLVMPQGSDYDYRDYALDLSGGAIDFTFAIACSYGLPVNNRFERFTPVYQLPQFNKKAASEVRIGIATNDLIAGNTTSTASLDITVVDPNHGISVGAGLDQMRQDSSVAEITVEIPALLRAPLTIPGGTPVSGSGHDPADPLLYQTLVTNELGAIEGTYRGLVKVRDTYSPGQNTAPLLAGQDGLSREDPPLGGLFAISEFATYQVFSLEVAEDPSPTLGIWPTFGGTPGNTGNPGAPGPLQLHDAPTWTSGCDDWDCSGNPLPVFLDQERAYFSNTGFGASYPATACEAVDLVTHKPVWTRLFNDVDNNWLHVKGISITSLGTVGCVLETTTGNLYGLDGATGDEIWSIPTWGHMRVDAHVALDAAGNFIAPAASAIRGYEGAIGIYLLDARSGEVLWYAPTADPLYCTPAIGADGTIYVSLANRDLAALDPVTGDLLHSSVVGSSGGNALMVHPDGGILFLGRELEPGIAMYDDLGTGFVERWHQPYNPPSFSSAAVGQDDDIYLLDRDGILRRLDPIDGATLASTSGWGTGVSARPAVDSAGVVYFRGMFGSGGDSFFNAANPDCTLRWQHLGGSTSVSLFGAPALGGDGTVYSSFRTLGLVAWRDME